MLYNFEYGIIIVVPIFSIIGLLIKCSEMDDVSIAFSTAVVIMFVLPSVNFCTLFLIHVPQSLILIDVNFGQYNFCHTNNLTNELNYKF